MPARTPAPSGDVTGLGPAPDGGPPVDLRLAAVRILDPTGDAPPLPGDLWRVACALAEFRAAVLAVERTRRVPAWTWLGIGILAGLALGDLWP